MTSFYSNKLSHLVGVLCVCAFSANAAANVSCIVKSKDFNKKSTIFKDIVVKNNTKRRISGIKVMMSFDQDAELDRKWGKVKSPKRVNSRKIRFQSTPKDLSAGGSFSFGVKLKNKRQLKKVRCVVDYTASAKPASKPSKPKANSKKTTPKKSTKPKTSTTTPKKNAFNLPARLQVQNVTRVKEIDDINLGDKSGVCGKGKADLTRTSDQNGKCIITGVEKNEWVEFDTTTNSAGTYDIVLRASAENENAKPKVSLFINGKKTKTVNVPKTGSEKLQSLVVRDVRIPSGNNKIRVRFDSSSIYLNYVDVVDAESITGVPLLIESKASSNSKDNIAFPIPKDISKINTPKVAACKPIKIQLADDIRDSKALAKSRKDVEVAFEIKGDKIVAKHVRDQEHLELGLEHWQRIVTRIPKNTRDKVVQFNMINPEDQNDFGFFSSTKNKNNTGRKGYVIETALLYDAEDKNDPCSPLTPLNGLTDWNIVHEFGHAILLSKGYIETFSDMFDENILSNKKKKLPKRRKEPTGYPELGQVSTTGGFVSEYAERAGGDEEAVETFVSYIMINDIPTGDSLAAQKIRYFHFLPGMPEIRAKMRKNNVKK